MANKNGLVLDTAFRAPSPTSFKGPWATLYRDSLNALLERYAKRGPQYQMLADLAASLYVTAKRMEATGAIEGLESLDEIIQRQLAASDADDPEAMIAARIRAQAEISRADRAVKVYLQAIDALRKLIGQAQLYTEARRQEVIVTEVNSAVVETLRVVETMVDPATFARIISAVRAQLDRQAV